MSSAPSNTNIASRERRSSFRFPVTGPCPGEFIHPDTEEVYEAMMVDVCHHGLGVLLDPGPAPGDILTFRLPNPTPCELKFEVRWSAPSHDGQNVMAEMVTTRRVGLQLLDPTLTEQAFSLVRLLRQHTGIQIES